MRLKLRNLVKDICHCFKKTYFWCNIVINKIVIKEQLKNHSHMKKLIPLLFFILTFSLSNISTASHMMGGDMSYRCLGKGKYKITAKFIETVEVLHSILRHLVYSQEPMVEMDAEVMGYRFLERESEMLRHDAQPRVRLVLPRILMVQVRELKNILMKLQWILIQVH